MKSSNASHLMPIYREWQGNRRPVCLLPNRDGVLFSIDPFAPELPNWNGLIFGGSGAGKSFTVSGLSRRCSEIKCNPLIFDLRILKSEIKALQGVSLQRLVSRCSETLKNFV